MSDFGPGIAESFRGRIFQRFAQADGSDARASGGSGLGLAISKAIIEAMGAEYMLKNAGKLENRVYDVPEEIDRQIAALKLDAMGVKIDVLTEEQIKYLNAWESGT